LRGPELRVTPPQALDSDFTKAAEASRPLNFKFLLQEKFLLPPLFVLGFVSRFYPLLEFPRVGNDPLLHFEFSQALLQGKMSIQVVIWGQHLTIYYPPLFHLLSLAFFLAFPTVDPYLIMKVIVSMLDSLQLFPIYFIVKEVSKSTAGASMAAFIAMVTPSDFNMIAWGGYTNIAGLLLIAVLAYFVIKERAVAVGIVSTILFLTHHLSMLFAIAVLFPYYLIIWCRTRKVPKCLLGLVAAMGVAFAAFYWQALIPQFELYTTNASQYATFTLPGDWTSQFGHFESFSPLLILAAIGVGLWVYKSRLTFAKSDLFLYLWLLWPLLLGYSFLFGIRWDVVRWIYFLQQPACVWCGIAVAQLKGRKYLKYLVVLILLVFVWQWINTMNVYYWDISTNAVNTY